MHAGGSAGIGKATALQFDANGCKVAVLGRRLERLEAVVKQMKHGYAVVGDLTQVHIMDPFCPDVPDAPDGASTSAS